MTDKEIKVLYDSLTSEENAYALVKQNGYTGTMEDLMVLCSKAADDMSMNMDDMEQVAGGSTWDDIKNFTGNAVDKTLDALGKTWDWIQENPGTTAEIVGGTLAAVAGITYVVKRRGSGSNAQLQQVPGKTGQQNVVALADIHVNPYDVVSQRGRVSDCSSAGSVNLLDI